MPSPIQRGRYKNREEIIAAIDKKLRRLERLKKTAAKLYAEAKEIVRESPEMYGTARGMTECADDKMHKALMIEQRSLPYLKTKLAEFDTLILPTIQIDRSIQK